MTKLQKTLQACDSLWSVECTVCPSSQTNSTIISCNFPVLVKIFSKLADALDNLTSPIRCLANGGGLGEAIRTEQLIAATSQLEYFQFYSLARLIQDSSRHSNSNHSNIDQALLSPGQLQ